MKPTRARNSQRGAQRPRNARTRFLWVLLSALLASHAAVAHARERQHEVRPGQTLGGIADHYGVTKWSVAGLNGIDPETMVKAGEVLLIPPRDVVYINPGQTLWSVARRHHMTVEELAKLNKLETDALLHPGQRLILPGFKPGRGERANWGKPSRPGRVTLYRIAHQETLTVTLVDRRGRVRRAALNQMARFMRPRGSNRTKSPSRRLMALLARISDHFGGRRITVISGYRTAGGYTGAASRHVAAAALDIRIQGVPNTILRDYCRSLPRTGCGYYPNSTFVHVDSRDSSAYWVDVSRPGARPEYVDPADFRAGKMLAKHIDGDKEAEREAAKGAADAEEAATPEAGETAEAEAGAEQVRDDSPADVP